MACKILENYLQASDSPLMFVNTQKNILKLWGVGMASGNSEKYLQASESPESVCKF